MKLSLHGRLAIWYAIAIPTLIFILAFTAQQVMVLNLDSGLDAALKHQAEAVAETITSGLSETDRTDVIAELISQDSPSIPLLLRIADPQGRVLVAFGNTPEAILPSLDRQFRIIEDRDAIFDTIQIRGIETLRVYTSRVKDPQTQQTVAIVQTGESLSQTAVARDRLWLYTIMEAAVGSLVTLAVGMFILHKGFRPLRSILKRVQEIESSNLRSGLPDEPRPPELQQLADSLNTMWHRLDIAFRTRQMFVANVSHEIRTPLTAIEGQIEVMLMQPSLDPEVRESLERMAREVRRLVRMTNKLLLNAQLQANPTLAIEQVNLRALLEDAIAAIWVLAEDLDLELAAPEDVTAYGDYDMLKQLVLNLVENAIKFTPRGGRIELALSTEGEGQWAVVQVSDTGEGIPAEHLLRVTDAFYKAHSRRGSIENGAGLGLAIVKQIVELHHGQFEIRSQVGQGTTVRVRLPTTPPPPEARKPLADSGLDRVVSLPV